ncbi:MAG TPA: hypothetical protein VLZ32_01745 [Rhodanobacter sp.]|nr:hypothetical protein [Rhodanobacter sp.]
MKLIREFCRRRLAGRPWLTVGADRRERGFVVTVPPPLAATVADGVHAVQPAPPPAIGPSFAPLSH